MLSATSLLGTLTGTLLLQTTNIDQIDFVILRIDAERLTILLSPADQIVHRVHSTLLIGLVHLPCLEIGPSVITDVYQGKDRPGQQYDQKNKCTFVGRVE